MIKVSVFKTSGQYRGFRSEGHAGYAEEGYDIICSAVSVLAVNAVNSIEAFTDDEMDVTADDGLIELRLGDFVSDAAKLLLDSFVLGIQGICDSYGNEYIELVFEEV